MGFPTQSSSPLLQSQAKWLAVQKCLHFVYSFECNLHCQHCLYRCGPREKVTMGISRAKRFLEQAHTAGIRQIVFNGGEPFRYYADVRVLIQYARERRMGCALISNGSWGTTRGRARDHLADLKKQGLRSITLSTDRYHLLAVPLENIVNILLAAQSIGVRAGVKIARHVTDPVAEGIYRSLRAVTPRIALQHISPLGRGASLRERVPLKPVSELRCPGCLTPPVLLPHGNLLNCCNTPARELTCHDHPLVLGNLEKEPLKKLLSARRTDPLLGFLRTRGPASLAISLQDTTSGTPPPVEARYHDGCDLCFHLFRNPVHRSVAYENLQDRLYGDSASYLQNP